MPLPDALPGAAPVDGDTPGPVGPTATPDTNEGGAQGRTAPTAWAQGTSAGLRHAGRGARAVVTTLAERRGLRTVLLGGLVTLVAISLGGAFEVPLLCVGLVMLVIGAMGPRLGGHLGLDFGPEGTAITFHAHVAPPGRRLLAEPDEPTVLTLPPRPRIALAPTQEEQRRPEPPVATEPTARRTVADVESTGETMEIDAHDLRARLDAEPVIDRGTRAG